MRRAACAGDEAVFLAGLGSLNRIVGRFFEIHQHMNVASIFWELSMTNLMAEVREDSSAEHPPTGRARACTTASASNTSSRRT
ncbi:conserved hypothetical protein [Paraburkholderia caribensis]|nr:conserved hypothetical protein [Paraburkholderia caribensis]